MKKHCSRQFLSRRKFLISGTGVGAGILILNEGPTASAKPQEASVANRGDSSGSLASLVLRIRPTVLLIQKDGEVQQLFTATISSSKTTLSSQMEVVVSDGKKEWRAPLSPSTPGFA